MLKSNVINLYIRIKLKTMNKLKTFESFNEYNKISAVEEEFDTKIVDDINKEEVTEEQDKTSEEL